MHNLINFTAEYSWGNAWKQWSDSPPMINQHTEENILACAWQDLPAVSLQGCSKFPPESFITDWICCEGD